MTSVDGPEQFADQHMRCVARIRQDLLRSIRHSPLATIITEAAHPDNAVIAINAAFTQLSGYAEADIIGRNCRIMSGRDSAPQARAEMREAVLAGRPAFVTITNYRKTGEPFCNAVMIAPVHDEDGNVAFFVGTQIEVQSESQQPESQQADIARARLACLTPQQTRVLAYMAHGLRHAEIARELALSVKTIKMHRGALVQRLGVATSIEAIRIAVEAGL